MAKINQRLIERDKFIENSFWERPLSAKRGIYLVMGTLKDGKGNALQSVSFDENRWDELQARAWMKSIADLMGSVAVLPEEAAALWIEAYDNACLEGKDEDAEAVAWDAVKGKWHEVTTGTWQKFSSDWVEALGHSQYPTIEIAKAGKYPQGDLSIADFDSMIKNFEERIVRPPMTIDHLRKGPSFGWARKLFRVGSTLWATLEEINPKFREKVNNGAYKGRSIEVYRNFEYQGKRYGKTLKAITFLGAAEPAIKGMLEPAFKEVYKNASKKEIESHIQHCCSEIFMYSIDHPDWFSDQPYIGYPIDVNEEHIRIRQKEPSAFQEGSFRTISVGSSSEGIQAVIGKLKDEAKTSIQSYLFDKSKWTLERAKAWVAEHGGKYSEDELLTLYQGKGVKRLLELTQDELNQKIADAVKKAVTDYKAEQAPENQKAIDKAKTDAEKAAETKFNEEKVKLQKDKDDLQKKLDAQAAKEAKADALAFCEKLSKDGKLIAAHKEGAAALIVHLAKDETVIAFSEKDKAKPVDWFKKFLESMPDVVKMEELTKAASDNQNPENDPLYKQDPEGVKTRNEIHKYMESKKQSTDKNDPSYAANYETAYSVVMSQRKK